MLKISLRPSRLLAGILTLAHGAAIAIVMSVNLPLWAKIIAATILLVHLLVVARRQALLLAADSAVAVEVSSDNRISVQARSGAWNEYEVLGSTYAMPYLTVLNLRQHDGRARKRITLLADSLHADDFRKLRVWLHWKGEDGAP